MSGDAYEIAWQVMLSPLKLLFIILLGALAGFIIYSIIVDIQEKNLDDAELGEINNVIVYCLTDDSLIQKNRLTEDFLSKCVKSKKYGIRVKSDDKDLFVNEPVYTSYRGFCNRLAKCSFMRFTDLEGNSMDIEVVLKKENDE